MSVIQDLRIAARAEILPGPFAGALTAIGTFDECKR